MLGTSQQWLKVTTAVVLILIPGLRRGEVLGLTWPMVDLESREVEISRGLQRVGGELVNG